MSFNLDDFLHKPQVPTLANRAYYDVVRAVAPSLTPPHAIQRTVEQLAKGLIFDYLVNVGDTPNQTFLDLAKSGVTSASPYIPFVFLYKNSDNNASLTGTYVPTEQNILPSSEHRAIVTFHQRVKFDVDFINNHTVKQVALIDLGIPYSSGLSLQETVELFRDTFASFIQYPQLADLYRRSGYAGSQVITSVTTIPDMSWNVSCKLMLVLNAFGEENAQIEAQLFANEFTNIWVNALAHVVGLEEDNQLQELADNISENFINFTFHCFPENIVEAIPNVNQQLFGLEKYLLDNADKVSKLTTKDVVNGSLQAPELGQITPAQLLRLACSPYIDKELQSWCIDKWLEYVRVFANGDNRFLPDQYYLYVLEYGRESFTSDISQARQDYFFKLNRENDNRLQAKIPVDLMYTIINPCILDTSLLNLAENQPTALPFYFQLLIDLHNNVLGQLVNQEELAQQGYTQLFLPVEWLWLCGYIAPDLIQTAVILSKQETLDFEAPELTEQLSLIEQKVNSWIQAGYLHEKAVASELELSPRRQVLRNTFVTYYPLDFAQHIAPTEKEAVRPSAILAADVFNLSFDTVSQIAIEVTKLANEHLSPEAYAKQVADDITTEFAATQIEDVKESPAAAGKVAESVTLVQEKAVKATEQSAKAVSKEEVETKAKGEARADIKAEAKVESKSIANAEVTDEAKANSKVETKPAEKADTKTESKMEIKAASKAESKGVTQNDVEAENTSAKTKRAKTQTVKDETAPYSVANETSAESSDPSKAKNKVSANAKGAKKYKSSAKKGKR